MIDAYSIRRCTVILKCLSDNVIQPTHVHREFVFFALWQARPTGSQTAKVDIPPI